MARCQKVRMAAAVAAALRVAPKGRASSSCCVSGACARRYPCGMQQHDIRLCVHADTRSGTRSCLHPCAHSQGQHEPRSCTLVLSVPAVQQMHVPETCQWMVASAICTCIDQLRSQKKWRFETAEQPVAA